MRQRIVVAALEHHPSRKVGLQLSEELLVLRLATAQHHQAELAPLQHLRQDSNISSMPFCCASRVTMPPERHFRADGQFRR